MISHLAKKTGQQKQQLGQGVVGDREVWGGGGGGCGQNLIKRRQAMQRGSSYNRGGQGWVYEVGCGAAKQQVRKVKKITKNKPESNVALKENKKKTVKQN